MGVRPQTLAAILAAAQRITGPIFSENFDGVTAPALPASLDFDSTLVTSAASLSGMSAPNQLLLTGGTISRVAQSVSTDTAGGNVTVRGLFRFVGNTTTRPVGMLFGRASVSMLESAASGTAYAMRAQLDTGMRVFSYSAGTATQIGSTIGASGAFAQNVTYLLELTIDKNMVTAKVRRMPDRQWLTTTGVWQQMSVVCFGPIANASIAEAAGKFGAILETAEATASVYADNLAVYRRFNVFGDSITAGFGVSETWLDILDAARGDGWVNYARSGDQAADAALKAYNIPPRPSLVFIGANDQRTGGYGSNATKRGHWAKFIRAILVWCSCNTKSAAQSATTSGAWSSTTVYGGALGRNATGTAGSTLTFTGISGSTIYIGYTVQAAQTGTWKITVDGVDVATGGTANDSTNTINGLVYAPEVLRISGLSSGAHTVIFTTTNTGLCYCDYVAGIGNQTSPNTVRIGNVLGLNATGYATLGVDATNVAAYNADLATVVSELQADGLPVGLVDLNALPMTYNADGFHIDAAGHAAVAAAFAAAL